MTVPGRLYFFPLVALIFCLSCCGVSARTIEVALSGNDEQAGTHEQPLKTIARALDMAGAGDTVRIGPGEFREGQLTIKNGGHKGTPLVIEGEPGGKTVIKGSQIVKGWRLGGGGLWKVENWPVNSQQLLTDGRPLQQIGANCVWNRGPEIYLPPVGRDARDVRAGSFYYDPFEHALYCMLPGGLDPNWHLMEASTASRVLDGNGRSFVTVRNLTLMHSNGSVDGRGALLYVDGPGWVIEDCTFEQGDFSGLLLEGDEQAVRRCKFFNNGNTGLGINGSDAQHHHQWVPERSPQNLVFEDLTIMGNNYRRFNPDWEAGGMKLMPSIRGATIRRCYVSDNLGHGIWLDSVLGSNIVEDCIVAGNEYGILYEVSTPCRGDSFGALIRNNRVAENRRIGIFIVASTGATVINNTCYRNKTDISLDGMPRREFGLDMQLKDNVVEDNLLSGKDCDVIIYVGEGSSNNRVNGNYYAHCAGPAGLGEVGSRRMVCNIEISKNKTELYLDLGKLFKDYSFEEHGIVGDLCWINPRERDFRLLEKSPAKGKGWQPE
jgi:parallel beta-helix repeat protein